MNPNMPTGETMSDGDPTMPAGGAGAAAPAPISVPLAFLAQPDNDEQMQTPAKGDTGTMQVDYTVVDIQGDMAMVLPNSVNGNDLGAKEDEQAPDPDEQEGSDLQDMAQQMSQGQ